MEVKRYNFDVTETIHGPAVERIEDSYGDYVEYEDHHKVILALTGTKWFILKTFIASLLIVPSIVLGHWLTLMLFGA